MLAAFKRLFGNQDRDLTEARLMIVARPTTLMMLAWSLLAFLVTDNPWVGNSAILSFASLCLALLFLAIVLPSWRLSQNLVILYFLLGSFYFLWELIVQPELISFTYYVLIMGFSRFMMPRIIAVIFLIAINIALVFLVAQLQLFNISILARTVISSCILFLILDHFLVYGLTTFEAKVALIFKATIAGIVLSLTLLFLDYTIEQVGNKLINILVILIMIVNLALCYLKPQVALGLFKYVILINACLHFWSLQENFERTAVISLVFIALIFAFLDKVYSIAFSLVIVMFMAGASKSGQFQIASLQWILYLNCLTLATALLFVIKPFLEEEQVPENPDKDIYEFFNSREGGRVVIAFSALFAGLVFALGPTIRSPALFGGQTQIYQDGNSLWLILSFIFAIIATKVRFDEQRSRSLAASTLELAKNLRNQKVKLLHRANQLNGYKKTFLTGVNRSLKEPIDFISHSLEPFAKQGPYQDLLTIIPELRLQSKRLQQDIENLLQFSRLELKKLPSNQQAVDILSFIEENFIKKHANLSLDKTKLKDSCYIVDSAQLLQIFNAVLFHLMPDYADSSIKIVLENNAQLINISFINSEHSLSESVFSIFNKSDDDSLNEINVEDLELILLRNLIVMLDGTIELKSDYRGTLISINLPLVAAESPVKPDQNVIVEEKTNQQRPIILIVEDDPLSARLITKILAKIDADFQVCDNANDALEFIHTNKVDILLSDIGLPDIDGLSLIKLIRQEGSNLLAFALTGWQSPEHIAQFKEGGFQDVFTKPIDIDHLRETIIQSIKVKHHAQQ